MKFLCLDCDEPMKLHSTEGPDEGSLSVTFRCPECGFRVAMLTNPFETQMVRSLGVKVGGRTGPAEPFETLRSTMAGARSDAFEGTGETGGSCPFAAAARLERIPGFIRPMAKRSIERFAAEHGHATVTERVMDEARAVFGM